MAEVPEKLKRDTTLKCGICGTEGTPTLEVTELHLKASCTVCGSYLRFVPKNPTWKALARLQGQTVPD